MKHSPRPRLFDAGIKPSGERHIRSYACRQRRITDAQRQALEHLWDRYGLNPEKPIDAMAAFSRKAPLIVEIGFGDGETLATMAAENPQFDYLGIEVHRPGVGHLLLRLDTLSLGNVKVVCADAVDILQGNIEDASLAGVHLFFPDPWPKKRHHKRRLMNAGFAGLMVRKLEDLGYFHAATDCEDYAHQMLAVLEACRLLENTAGKGRFAERPPHRPLTRFEARGQRLGHQVWDLTFRKRASGWPLSEC